MATGTTGSAGLSQNTEILGGEQSSQYQPETLSRVFHGNLKFFPFKEWKSQTFLVLDLRFLHETQRILHSWKCSTWNQWESYVHLSASAGAAKGTQRSCEEVHPNPFYYMKLTWSWRGEERNVSLCPFCRDWKCLSALHLMIRVWHRPKTALVPSSVLQLVHVLVWIQRLV